MTKSHTVKSEVLEHYAKSLDLNAQFKDFISKMGLAGMGFCVYQVLLRLPKKPASHVHLGSALAFECLSLIIIASSMIFIKRVEKLSLSAFQAALGFTLLQLGVYTLARVESRESTTTTLVFPDQLPFGSLYFMMTWAFDRYMVSMITQASNRLKDKEC